MLPPFIIEQLRRREQHRRQERPQQQLELPVEPLQSPKESSPPDEPGVVIIPLWD